MPALRTRARCSRSFISAAWRCRGSRRIFMLATGMLFFWTPEPVAPWQDAAWLASMRRSLRPNQYLRMVENRWASTEESFISLDWFDACVDPNARMLVGDPQLSVYVGVDASVKHDSTAIVAVAFDRKAQCARLIWHRIFQPSPDEPLDFEATIEATLL